MIYILFIIILMVCTYIFNITILLSCFTAFMGYIGAIELGISSEFFKFFLGGLGFIVGLMIAPFIKKRL